MSIGKDYKKGDPVRGAAILLLSLEKMGQSPAGIKDVVKGTFNDLGVTEKQVRKYLIKHRKELEELAAKQGLSK